MDTPDRVVARALRNVTEQDDGCVISLYSVGSHGYAQIGWHDEDGNQRMALIHRVAYAALVGPIPDGMTVDHLCRRRKCLNPDHLRLLSNVDNARDNGQVRTNEAAGRTCTKHGTEMAISRGKATKVYCRECSAEARRKRRQRASA